MLPEAESYQRRQQRAAAQGVLAARRVWRLIDPADLTGSWRQIVARLVAVVTAAQLIAAEYAEPYVEGVLLAQGIDPERSGSLQPAAVTGVASDGRSLDGLLFSAVADTKLSMKSRWSVNEDGGRTVIPGLPPERALAVGQTKLDTLVSTMVFDAGRAATLVSMVTSRRATGYVRMLSGASCSRCVILAGRFYRYNQGFQRHPRCDCVHVPSREDRSGDLRTDPDAYFKSLSREQQDKAFTKAGAEAIRLGADPAQVVNARRGALGLTPATARITKEEARILRNGAERGQLQAQSVFGRPVFVTTEGTTTRGLAGQRLRADQTKGVAAGDRYRRARTPRLMPESILQIAENREDAQRLLKRFGYIL